MALINLLANGLMFVGLATSLGVAYLAWQKRQRPTARTLTAMMLVSILWIGAELAKQQMNTGWSTELMRRVAFVSLLAMVFVYLVFSLRYAGYEELLTGRNLLLLALHPVIFSILVFTNDYPNLDVAHQLMWTAIPIGNPDVNMFQRGTLWYVHAVYSYGALLGSTALLIYRTQTREDVYQEQGVAITLAVLAPLAANAVSISGIWDIPDLTPAALGVTGLALFWGMRSYGIGEVTPIARENVVQSLSAGILVVDSQNAVSEINDRTREMFAIEDENPIGESLESVFSHLPGFYERYEDAEDETDEIQVEIEEGETRSYEVQVSPVEDKSGKRVGRMFMFHDVTERKRRERELELQNKQLDQFASLVTHEIQSPLETVRDRVDRTIDRANAENRGDLVEAKQSLSEMDDLVDEVLSLASEGGAVTQEEAKRVGLETTADQAWWSVTQRDLPATLAVEDADVMADPDRLDRIFRDLFENAIRYAGEDATVEVGVIDDEVTGHQGFYVQDDGPGIPEDAREAVFEPGVAGPDDATGLGLTIVETMAEAHDWDVAVAESSAGGARFEFTGVTFPERRAVGEGGVLGRTTGDD